MLVEMLEQHRTGSHAAPEGLALKIPDTNRLIGAGGTQSSTLRIAVEITLRTDGKGTGYGD